MTKQSNVCHSWLGLCKHDVCGLGTVLLQALVDGEVIEVENPDDPHGLPFYKFKTFEAKEETKHKKKVEWDKDKSKNDDGLDFSFDDVDLGMGFKDTGNALRAIAARATTESQDKGIAVGGNATVMTSGPSRGAGPALTPRPRLAIEDAKERDTIMSKVEEAVKGCGHVLLKAAKCIAHLPQVGMGKKSKDMVQECMEPVQGFEAKLKHLSIHGTVPGQTEPMATDDIKELLKEFQAYFNELKQALDMATPLLKTKTQSE